MRAAETPSAPCSSMKAVSAAWMRASVCFFRVRMCFGVYVFKCLIHEHHCVDVLREYADSNTYALKNPNTLELQQILHAAFEASERGNIANG